LLSSSAHPPSPHRSVRSGSTNEPFERHHGRGHSNRDLRFAWLAKSPVGRETDDRGIGKIAGDQCAQVVELLLAGLMRFDIALSVAFDIICRMTLTLFVSLHLHRDAEAVAGVTVGW
jgi:hypothetical protein